MGSAKDRGNQLVRFALEILAQQGYFTEHSHPQKIRSHGIWMNLGEDFFGAFDILAVSPQPRLGFYRGDIQVTDENHGTERRAKIDAAYGWPDLTPIAVIETWQWNPRREWFVRYRRISATGILGSTDGILWEKIGPSPRRGDPGDLPTLHEASSTD